MPRAADEIVQAVERAEEGRLAAAAGPMMPNITLRTTSRSRSKILRTSPKDWLKPGPRWRRTQPSSRVLLMNRFIIQ